MGQLIEISTPKDLENFKTALSGLIEQLRGDGNTKIGIAIPGLINYQKMICSPNLPFLDSMNLYDLLPDNNIKYSNDADAALLGEIVSSNLSEENVLLLTLGTGIGSAFYLNKTGSWQIPFSGEFGHVKVVQDGKLCSCGGLGCVESYFSGRAILEEGQKNINPTPATVVEIFDLAKSGNISAINIIKEAIGKLGIAIANTINLLGIQKIILSGKIADSYDFFIWDLEQSVIKNLFKNEYRNIEFQKSKLIDNASIIGSVNI